MFVLEVSLILRDVGGLGACQLFSRIFETSCACVVVNKIPSSFGREPDFPPFRQRFCLNVSGSAGWMDPLCRSCAVVGVVNTPFSCLTAFPSWRHRGVGRGRRVCHGWCHGWFGNCWSGCRSGVVRIAKGPCRVCGLRCGQRCGIVAIVEVLLPLQGRSRRTLPRRGACVVVNVVRATPAVGALLPSLRQCCVLCCGRRGRNLLCHCSRQLPVRRPCCVIDIVSAAVLVHPALPALR